MFHLRNLGLSNMEAHLSEEITPMLCFDVSPGSVSRPRALAPYLRVYPKCRAQLTNLGIPFGFLSTERSMGCGNSMPRALLSDAFPSKVYHCSASLGED